MSRKVLVVRLEIRATQKWLSPIVPRDVVRSDLPGKASCCDELRLRQRMSVGPLGPPRRGEQEPATKEGGGNSSRGVRRPRDAGAERRTGSKTGVAVLARQAEVRSPRSGGPLREARRVRHGRRLVPSGQGDFQDRKVVVEDVGPLQLAAVLDQPVHDVLG